METKILILYQFLHSLWPAAKKLRGKPEDYNWPSMVLFFMVMILKGVHSYQAMARYAHGHYRCFGWQKAPSRKTIARRFQALPQEIYQLMPLVAKAASQWDTQVFCFRWVFIDKSVFCAKGGLWHRVHRLLGVVPHLSIDTHVG
jgi:hypothetical protein